MLSNTRTSPDDSRNPPAAKRAWVRPVLVEYGPLAKLTRGTSGTIVESGKLKKSPCL